MEGSGNTPNRPYETLLYALSGTSAVTVIFGFEDGNSISEKAQKPSGHELQIVCNTNVSASEYEREEENDCRKD